MFKSTGPFKTLHDLVDLPYGEFKKIAQSYDPLWGNENSDEFQEYRAVFSKTIKGYATVFATDEKDAVLIVDNLPDRKITWDIHAEDYWSTEVLEIEPVEKIERDTKTLPLFGRR